MDLKELYREVILDHNRSPRNFGRLEPADSSALGRNPLCGDTLDITLRMDGDRVVDLRFEGQGCAISVAAASLMSEAVKGRRREEIAQLHGDMRPRQAGRAGWRRGISGACKVREPVLAHAQVGPGAHRHAGLHGVSHARV